MHYGTDASSLSARRHQQHRLAAARFLFVFGLFGDACGRWVLRGSLMCRAVFLRLASERVLEMVGNCVFHLVALSDDPHDEKKGHHSRDEVGVCDFPSAATFACHVLPEG
jgi:hypothetical protein